MYNPRPEDHITKNSTAVISTDKTRLSPRKSIRSYKVNSRNKKKEEKKKKSKGACTLSRNAPVESWISNTAQSVGPALESIYVVHL